MEPTITTAINSLIPNPPGYWVDNGIITAWDIGEKKLIFLNQQKQK